MSALKITITAAGYAALVNAQNTGTDSVLVSSIGVTEQAFDSSDAAAEAMTSLPGELKQLTTFAGDAVADDTIHVTIRDDGSDTYTLRGFGLYLADGTLLAVYGQPESILEKSAQAMLLLAADIRFTDIDTTVLEFGDTNWTNPPATDQTPGVVQLATPAQAAAGVDGTRAMTPATHKAAADARLGAGAPSTFVKSLLTLTTAALFRAALAIKGAALKDEGAGNGLDADLLDGEHGSYYRAWANITGRPSTFAPSSHSHVWADVTGKPTTATRWPQWSEVTGKPTAFAPSTHSHSAADINTGTLAAGRIPTLAMSKVSGLQGALNSKWDWNEAADSGLSSNTSLRVSDWNDLLGGPSKFVSGTGSAANAPFGAAGSGIYSAYSAAAGFVLAFSGINNEVYARTASTSGGWNPWMRLATEGSNTFTGTQYLETTASGQRKIELVHPTTGANGGIRVTNTPTTYIYAGEGGMIQLRPNGESSTQGATFVRNNGNLESSGTVIAAGGFDFGSSIKLKHVEGSLPYGLETVERMQTAAGRYRDEYNNDGRRRLFFIAEQLLGLIPEAVDIEGVEFNGERVPSVKLEQLLPVLANAITELSAKVRRLESITGQVFH